MKMIKSILTICTVIFASAVQAADRPGLVAHLNDTPELSTLVTALEAAGLTETLANGGPFTIYAPDNAAFASLPEGTLDVLLLPENAERLRDILLYHVDDRKLTTHRLIYGAEHYRPLLADARLCITREDSVTLADGSGEVATVTDPDIKVSNGVIHVIDKVLLPGTRPACH